MDKDFEVVASGRLTPTIADRYLNVYLGECSSGTWDAQLNKVWEKHRLGNVPIEEAKARLRNYFAHAILIPGTDKSINVGDSPENFFHKSTYFRQLGEQDWFAAFQKIAAEDADINKHRAQIQSLGVIDPIEYQPYTRQAYNWLCDKAEETGETTPGTPRVLKNLVYAYGGAVICSVFTNHSDRLQKIQNWRTGYFFERELYKVYTPEQMAKIKKQELNKTSPTLVKRVRKD